MNYESPAIPKFVAIASFISSPRRAWRGRRNKLMEARAGDTCNASTFDPGNVLEHFFLHVRRVENFGLLGNSVD